MDYYPGRVIGKRPAGVRIYKFGFVNFLADGDRATDVLVVADSGLTAEIVETNDDNVKIKISGGAEGEKYNVEMIADTLLGETVDMIIVVDVVDL